MLKTIKRTVNETLDINITQRTRTMNVIDGKKIYVLLATRLTRKNDVVIGKAVYRDRTDMIHLRTKGLELFETDKIFRDKYYQCLKKLIKHMDFIEKREFNWLFNNHFFVY